MFAFWAAGVQGPRILEDLDGLELARSRRLVVLATLPEAEPATSASSL